MIVKMIEATQGSNWGKFMLARFTPGEWLYPSAVAGAALLPQIGTSPRAIWVLDLQTCEGAAFVAYPGGSPKADLDKHRIWVCPLFEPFLTWLYRQDLSDLSALPRLVTLSQHEAPFQFYGYRRSGPGLDADSQGEHRPGCMGTSRQARLRRKVEVTLGPDELSLLRRLKREHDAPASHIVCAALRLLGEAKRQTARTAIAAINLSAAQAAEAAAAKKAPPR